MLLFDMLTTTQTAPTTKATSSKLLLKELKPRPSPRKGVWWIFPGVHKLVVGVWLSFCAFLQGNKENALPGFREPLSANQFPPRFGPKALVLWAVHMAGTYVSRLLIGHWMMAARAHWTAVLTSLSFKFEYVVVHSDSCSFLQPQDVPHLPHLSCLDHSGDEGSCNYTVDAEIITKLIPQTIFGVKDVITQIKLIPRKYFCVIGWQLQDLITHRNTHYITQINLPETFLCMCNGLHFTN